MSPNRPISFMPSTICVGYSSACSSSVATGMISLSTKVRTVARMSCWTSVKPSVCARRPMAVGSLVGVGTLRGPGGDVPVRAGGYCLVTAEYPGGRGAGECALAHMREKPVCGLGRSGGRGSPAALLLLVLRQAADHPRQESH